MTYLFFYVPIIVLIAFSFNNFAFPAPWGHFTLDWYRQLFLELDLWRSFFNSLVVAVSATFLSLLMGVILIFFSSDGGRVNKVLPLFYGNLIIPETVLAVSLLGYFTLFKVPLGLTTIIIAHTVLGIGFVIPVLYTRFKNLDPKLKEASLTLGASHLQTFFKVTLPLLKPTMIATGLLVFVISFDDFILTYFCAGTGVETLSIYLVSMIRAGISPVVNALSAILVLFSGILIFLFFSRKVKTQVF